MLLLLATAEVGRRLTAGLAFFLLLSGLVMTVMLLLYTPFAVLEALVTFFAEATEDDDFFVVEEDLFVVIADDNKPPLYEIRDIFVCAGCVKGLEYTHVSRGKWGGRFSVHQCAVEKTESDALAKVLREKVIF